MSKKVWFFVIFLVLGIAALVAYRLHLNKEKEAVNSSAMRGMGARVYGIVVQGEAFSDFLSLSGSIEPNEVVNLRSEISGIIESLNFEEGKTVSAGQTLIRINDTELRAQLTQAKTRYELAGENERRAKLLLEKEAISQEEYDIASADYRTAQSQIQIIEAQLDKTFIRAPFSGTIGLRNVSKGSYITPTSEIAQLVNMSKVKLQFSIPEKYASKVKINSTVKFAIRELASVFSAQIYAIEPMVDAATRTLRVRAIADNSGNHLVPGTFANVTFPLETVEDGLLVPAEALIPIQNGKKIFIKKNNVAKEVLVETGGRTDAAVLITHGIAAGDTVLTSGVMSLRDGSPIQVTLR